MTLKFGDELCDDLYALLDLAMDYTIGLDYLLALGAFKAKLKTARKGREDDMSETVTVEKIKKLILEYGNLTFDCGSWDGEDPESYRALQLKQAAANDALEAAITALITDHDVARAALEETLKRLPETMQHCTIQFKECAKGHGWLTATNWIQHDCDVCERDAARANVDAQAKEIEGLRERVRLYESLGPFEIVSGDSIHRLSPGSRQVVNSTESWVVGAREKSAYKLKAKLDAISIQEAHRAV